MGEMNSNLQDADIRQDVFFTLPLEAWDVEWRYKPHVFRDMVDAATTQRGVILRTLGNPWEHHTGYSTKASARNAQAILRRNFPGKSYRIVLSPRPTLKSLKSPKIP